MKVLVVFATLVVAVTLADVQWSAPSTHDNHYTSHKDTVQAARRVVSDRLQEYGVNDAQYAASGSSDLQRTVAVDGDRLCTVACGNGASETASASDVEQFDQSNVAVGYAGFNGQDNSNTEFNSQSEYSQSAHDESAAAAAAIIIPSAGSNSHSRYASTHEQQQHVSHTASPSTIVVPITTGGGGASKHYASHSERLTETSAAPTASYIYVAPTTAGGSESYTRNVNHESESIRSAPVRTSYYPISIGGGSADSEHQFSHTEQSSTNNHNGNSNLAAIIYPPTSGGASNSHYVNRVQNHHVTESRPQPIVVVPVNYGGAANNERYTHHQTHTSEVNTAPQRTIIYTAPAVGGNTEHHTSSHSERYTNRRVPAPAPIILAPAVRPSTSEHFVERNEQYRNTKSTPTYGSIIYPSASVGSNSHYTNTESESSASNNYNRQPQAVVYASEPLPAGGVSLFRNNHYENARSTSFDRPSTRVGSSLYGGNYHSTDLHSLISESERLAREQSTYGANLRGASSIVDRHASNAALSTSSSFDDNTNTLGAGFGGRSLGSLGGAGAGGNGGFVRTKAWENNEKWSSGTQFDESGRPRSYSTLSTAESELHNINGKSTGYKAATTTLENDGRVSTYSLHT